MSGIYIHGAEMPRACGECPFEHDYMSVCKMTGSNTFDSRSQWERMPNCPLIALSPHGRCVDVDALEKHMSDTVQGDIRGYPYDGDTWDLAFSWLDHADTIIPSDGGEKV